MRKKLIVANWKMHMLRREAKRLAEGIVNLVNELGGAADVVLAPPYTSLDVVYKVIRESRVQMAAQNVFWEAWGAFTGEISPHMLSDIGCKWAIIGHSERRNLLGETDIMVQKKNKISLDAGLIPIFCVGENLVEKEEDDTIGVIKRQVENGTEGLKLTDSARLVIAYEPVWAIGTGKNATSKEIRHVHRVIRGLICDIWGEIANDLRILYGGSVSPENIKEILHTPDVDGVLVGGASLQAESFGKIVQLAGE